MPFLAPLAPFAPALIKGGIGLGASLLGSKLGGKLTAPSSTEKSIMDAQLDQMRRSQQLSAEAFPIGLEGSRTGLDAARAAMETSRSALGRSFNPVMDYWSRLLSGNRASMTSALAPELNQMADQYQAARASAAALTPRGGGRASILAQLPFQQARDASTLMQTIRPQAAQGLLQAGQGALQAGQGIAQGGQLAGGIGSNLVSNAVQSLYGATAAGRSILDAETERRNRQQSAGAGIGGFLYDTLKGIDFGGMFGGGGKSAIPDQLWRIPYR